MSAPAALLEREVYTEAEAARLLRVPQSTLHYWLEGGRRGRKTYLPIIRPEATGSRTLMWGEFVEAALLRNYRARSVPMVELRYFIETLRKEFSSQYPLAHHKPWVSGRQLLFTAQQKAGLNAKFWLVSNNQGLLSYPGGAFLDQVKWDDDIAAAYRPHADPNSPVVIDPRVRFGRPSIKGISTEAIAEEVDAGSTAAEVAQDFGLDVQDVRWAVAFETTQAA